MSAAKITSSKAKLAAWERIRNLDRKAKEEAARRGEPLTTETYVRLAGSGRGRPTDV